MRLFGVGDRRPVVRQRLPTAVPMNPNSREACPRSQVTSTGGPTRHGVVPVSNGEIAEETHLERE